MPKVKTAAQYAADHETPEAAIDAAIADARSESAAARRFKRAYTPLVESLKLPSSVEDSDAAIDVARDAARDALAELSEPEDDGAGALLAEFAERLGLDLAPLEKLAENATDEQVSAAIDAALKPVTEKVGRVESLEREASITKAALALGKPQDALTEILEGKTLTARTVKGEDGKDAQEWGIGEGDKFKPLSEMRSIQLLGTVEAKPEAPAKPAPTGVLGEKAAPKTVAQRTTEVRKEISI